MSQHLTSSLSICTKGGLHDVEAWEALDGWLLLYDVWLLLLSVYDRVVGRLGLGNVAGLLVDDLRDLGRDEPLAFVHMEDILIIVFESSG